MTCAFSRTSASNTDGGDAWGVASETLEAVVVVIDAPSMDSRHIWVKYDDAISSSGQSSEPGPSFAEMLIT
jgi:hypothetical protein